MLLYILLVMTISLGISLYDTSLQEPVEYTADVQTDTHVSAETDVEYTADVQTVTHVTSEAEKDRPTTYDIATSNHLTQFDDYSHDLLARLVTAESGGESFDGQIAVAEVVLNRIASPDYPNSLYEVIYEHNQFEPVRNETINRPASESARKAVDEALNGSNIARGALFFYNEKTATSRWLDQFPTIVQIGNHTFK